jgi:hypothetical protein
MKKTIAAVFFAMLMISAGTSQVRTDNPFPVPIPHVK